MALIFIIENFPFFLRFYKVAWLFQYLGYQVITRLAVARANLQTVLSLNDQFTKYLAPKTLKR